MEKTEKIIVRNFINMKYPFDTHNLELDDIFDYYTGLCEKMLNNKKDLKFKIYPIAPDEEKKITDYIEKNSNNNCGKDMEIYYNLLKTSISILQKYYTEDGKEL